MAVMMIVMIALLVALGPAGHMGGAMHGSQDTHAHPPQSQQSDQQKRDRDEEKPGHDEH